MKFRNESTDDIKTNSECFVNKILKMNRNSENVSKTKKLVSGVGNNSKLNRKIFHKLTDTSSLSSNRNSSAHSEEDVRVRSAFSRPQVAGNASQEEQEQVMKKLQAQVKDLRHKLRVLEESVDSKDYSLGTMAREKDRAIGEIRRLERSNKQLRQQLHDERNHYLEEKERFCEEMAKCKKKLQEVKSGSDGKKSYSTSRNSLINQSLRWQLNKEKGDFAESKTSKSQKHFSSKGRKAFLASSISLSDSQIRKPDSVESLHLYEGEDVSLKMTALRTENAKLRSIICERDERNYELCLRFLRMKHYKNDIKNRFQDLENEYLQVIANLMDKIDEARQEFNFIIDQKFKRPLHSTNAMYLQMVQRNSRMAFENASLRLENQCLKKELNKHMNSTPELETRKEQHQSSGSFLRSELESKLTLEDSSTERKLKRIKKNVNFKEIRTIYERDFNFKNSDTDSNYMSKTSTTAPSNISLGDPKSSESIVGDVQNRENKIVPNFQANSLPDEILNKIFKRIDTSNSQSLDSIKAIEAIKAESNSKGGSSVDQMLPDINEKDLELPLSSDRQILQEEPSETKQENDSVIEHKRTPKITDSSSPCDSKESVQFDAKARSRQTLFSTNAYHSHQKVEETGKDYLPMRREVKSTSQQSWAFSGSFTSRKGYFKKETERSNLLELPLKRFTFSGWDRVQRQETVPHTGQEGDVPRARSRFRMKLLKDGCGLQESFEISDAELPPPRKVGSTDTVDTAKCLKDRSGRTTSRAILTESEDEKTNRSSSIRALPPAIGSRSKSTNKLSLEEELLEATRLQKDSEETVWRRNVHHTTTRNSPKEQKTGQENTDKSLQCDLTPIIKHELAQNVDVTQSRKPEASKRFSQRLVSTSPEQLRSILTESQLQTFHMNPIIVGHATTEITPAFRYGDSNEIFLQLVIPQKKAAPVAPAPPIFLDKEALEKEVLEKENSLSLLSPVCPTIPSPNPAAEACSSDVRIHVSSLPTSNSTMDIIESIATNDRNNIMMRTLSAPGLLESNWLDPYNICETRDCKEGNMASARKDSESILRPKDSVSRIGFRVYEPVDQYRHYFTTIGKKRLFSDCQKQ